MVIIKRSPSQDFSQYKTIFQVILLLGMLIFCTGCNLIPGGFSTQNLDTKEAELVTQTILDPLVEIPVKAENHDWSSIWIENANQSQLPRLLLVGDSITDGYYSRVQTELSDQYYLGRYTTSKFLGNPDFQQELITILDRYQFEIIQVNNGLHGWDYTINEYRESLEDLSDLLVKHAPDATIIWCMTTPVRLEGNLDYLGPLNDVVVSRNQSAKMVMEARGFLITDLYSLSLPHPEYYRPDGFHFNEQGQTAQAELIISSILQISDEP